MALYVADGTCAGWIDAAGERHPEQRARAAEVFRRMIWSGLVESEVRREDEDEDQRPRTSQIRLPTR
eukprot:scaffold141626_cov22-Cyclotella_meneghiniana.AAC.1